MASGSETIYIKADRNIEVTKPDVTLGMYLKYRVSIHLLLRKSSLCVCCVFTIQIRNIAAGLQYLY